MIPADGVKAVEDRTRFRALIEQYGGLVLQVAESFTSDPDEAEDLFQEIWLTAWSKRDQFRGQGSWSAWLMILSRNVCRSKYRSDQARAGRMDRYAAVTEEEDHAWRPEDPHASVEEGERSARLHRALETLSEREHEAVVLRVLEGRAPEEVARIMGVKKATVRSLLRKAVTRLREVLNPEPQQEPEGANGG